MLNRLIGIAIALPVVLLSISTVLADKEFHSLRLDLFDMGVEGHPALLAGHIVDIHTDGDNVAGHEAYMINGAAPQTDYSVVLDLKFGGCASPEEPFPLANGVVLSTNEQGTASADTFLAQEQLAGLAGLTLGIVWRLVLDPLVVIEPTTGLPVAIGGTTAYDTGDCVDVPIDDNRN